MSQDSHMSECSVEFVRTSPDAIMPFRRDDGDSGFDLCSIDEVTLKPGQRLLINTGWLIAIQHGWEGQVRSRSGNALNKGIFVLNSPGTVDSSYRGSVGVILFNASSMPFTVTKGTKVAQMVFQRVPSVSIREVKEFTFGATARGTAGYGSSGEKA